MEEVDKEDYRKVIKTNAYGGYGRKEEIVNGGVGTENGCA